MKKIKTSASGKKRKTVELKTYQMSERTERVVLQALRDYKHGKTHIIQDIDTFLKEL